MVPRSISPSRLFSGIIGFLVLAFAASAVGEEAKVQSTGPSGTPGNGKFRVYVGTYTAPGKSQGIYRLELDAATARLGAPTLAVACGNPSFLAIHPSGRFIYATGSMDAGGGKAIGAVQAFAFEPKTGNLLPLNQEPCGGEGTCHIICDHAGKHVLVANYNSGSAAVLPTLEDGRVGKMCSFVQHHGSSVDSSRQEGPHAHSINLDAPNHFAFVADLGLDKVLVYCYDPQSGSLAANDPPAAAVAPGSGPRHFAFAPNGQFAYVINEMANTVTAFSYNARLGELKTIQTISTLPPGYKGESYTAEVQVHPSGKFLYGSNRGHDSIAVFKIDPAAGTLTAVSYQGTGIKTPRNFGLDPTGRALIVANQDGDSLVAFRIDPNSGELTAAGPPISVPMPVCVKMIAVTQ